MANDPKASWRDLVGEGRLSSLALVCLGIWLMAADSLVTATIMPSVGAELDGYAWFGWATSGFLVGVVVAGASAGWLSGRVGLRGAMFASGLLLAAGCVLSALSGTIAGFLIGRVVQGIASGWVMGLCYVTIGVVFPERHLPRVFALATSVWGIATFIGLLIGGVMADAGAWRGVFWLFAAQAVLFSAAALHLIKAVDRDPDAGRVPTRQLLLLTLGISAMAAAGVVAGRAPAVALLLVGVVLLAQTLRVDRRAPPRMLPLDTANPGTVLGAAYATYFTMSAAAVGFAVYAPAMLQFTAGLSALEAGYLVAVEAAAWTATALLVSGAGEPWRGRFIVIGSAATAIGVAALPTLMATAHIWPIAAAGALLGGGFGLCSSFISRHVMVTLSADERALGSGAIGAVRNAGGAVGAAIAGIAANFAGFSGGLTTANTELSALLIFGIGIPFAIAGLLAAIRLVRLSRPILNPVR